MEVKVIEYDDQTKDSLNDAIAALNETVQLAAFKSAVSGLDISKLLQKFSNKFLEKYTKNDLIINHKTTLHACDSFKHSNKEKYFIDGTLAIIRVPEIFNAEDKWDNAKVFSGDASYIKLRIVQRK